MPNDATHRITNYLMLSIFIVLNFYFNIEQDYKFIMIFIGSYILGTEVFNPDLDTNSKPLHRLGVLSYFITYPIRFVSSHRGLLHNIFIGWFLIEIYLAVIGYVLLFIVCKIGLFNEWSWVLNLKNIITFLSIFWKEIFAFSFGLFLSDALHIMADKISDYKNSYIET